MWLENIFVVTEKNNSPPKVGHGCEKQNNNEIWNVDGVECGTTNEGKYIIIKLL